MEAKDHVKPATARTKAGPEQVDVLLKQLENSAGANDPLDIALGPLEDRQQPDETASPVVRRTMYGRALTRPCPAKVGPGAWR